MKKIITYAFIISLIISGCGTHAAQGAYTGSQIGSVLGSAIGGLSDGWRGSNVGTIAGLVGGAVVGGAIGNAIDKSKDVNKDRSKHYEEKYDDDDSYVYDEDAYIDEKEERNYNYDGEHKRYGNSSDDVNAKRRRGTVPSRYMHAAELQNIMFYDADDNGILSAEENAELVFEIYNRSSRPLYDVMPVVEQTSSLKHIAISSTQKIDKIEPGRSVRYTAFIRTGRKLKEGCAFFRISVCDSSDKLLAPRTEFEVETRR